MGSSTGNRTDAYSNHVNQAVFSQTFYEEEDAFPLLYVTSGNAGGADEDGYYGRCAVERITMKEQEDGTLSFSSELMQTIILTIMIMKLEITSNIQNQKYPNMNHHAGDGPPPLRIPIITAFICFQPATVPAAHMRNIMIRTLILLPVFCCRRFVL